MEEKFPGITIREQLAEELNLKEDRIQVIQVDYRLNFLMAQRNKHTRKAIACLAPESDFG